MMKRNGKENLDPGFGKREMRGSTRVINPDGTVNIRRTGVPFLASATFYQAALRVSWKKFLLFVFIAYMAVNAVFATAYYLIGMENFNGVETNLESRKFMDAFFFSAQTLTTVGYGYISPREALPSIVAAIESMLGLLAFALATGVLYGRFSSPRAHIHYSEKALIAPYRDITAFMFRIANLNRSELIESEATVMLAINNRQSGKREFHVLELELNRINFLALTWTLVHPIDEKSPIYGMTLSDLEDGNAEFMIMVKAFDDTFSQQVYSRTSYKSDDIVRGAKFIPLVPEPKGNGMLHIDLSRLGAYEKVQMD